MSLTLQSKNSTIFTSKAKEDNQTWDDTEETWDEIDRTWDNPVITIKEQTKNTTSFTNQSKNNV